MNYWGHLFKCVMICVIQVTDIYICIAKDSTFSELLG